MERDDSLSRLLGTLSGELEPRGLAPLEEHGMIGKALASYVSAPEAPQRVSEPLGAAFDRGGLTQLLHELRNRGREHTGPLGEYGSGITTAVPGGQFAGALMELLGGTASTVGGGIADVVSPFLFGEEKGTPSPLADEMARLDQQIQGPERNLQSERRGRDDELSSQIQALLSETAESGDVPLFTADGNDISVGSSSQGSLSKGPRVGDAEAKAIRNQYREDHAVNRAIAIDDRSKLAERNAEILKQYVGSPTFNMDDLYSLLATLDGENGSEIFRADFDRELDGLPKDEPLAISQIRELLKKK